VTDIQSAQLSFCAAIAAAVIAAIGPWLLHLRETRVRIKADVMEERKKALFDALKVIDLVYASVDFKFNDQNRPALNQTPWSVQLARDAVNRMIVYCVDPAKTVATFRRAIGLYNPVVESPRGFSFDGITAFRKEVARELELPGWPDEDATYSWIYSLPGTAEQAKFRELQFPK